MVQWLILQASNVGGKGSIPCLGTKISCVTWHVQKIKITILKQFLKYQKTERNEISKAPENLALHREPSPWDFSSTRWTHPNDKGVGEMKKYEEKTAVYNYEDEVHKQKPRPNTSQAKYLNLESYQKP